MAGGTFNPQDPAGYTRLKTAVLLVLMAFLLVAGKSWKQGGVSIHLSLDPPALKSGQSLTASVQGPPGAEGDIFALDMTSIDPKYLGSFVLDASGNDQLSLQPWGTGKMQLYAVTRDKLSSSAKVLLVIGSSDH